MSKEEKLKQLLERAKEKNNTSLAERIQTELNKIETEKQEREFEELKEPETPPSKPEELRTRESKVEESKSIIVEEKREEISSPPTTPKIEEAISTPPPTPPVPVEKTLPELFSEIETRVEKVDNIDDLRELLKISWRLRTRVSEKIEESQHLKPIPEPEESESSDFVENGEP